MTRINVVPVEELSDSHLLAEYRELPRIIKQYKSPKDAFPENYRLGKGHVLWARKYSYFCICRYEQLCKELTFRGMTVNFPVSGLRQLYITNIFMKGGISLGYIPTIEALYLNQIRLLERITENPAAHRWTNRQKPDYVKGIV